MARQTELTLIKATRSSLNAQGVANGLVEAEPYFISDEGRMAVGTGTGTYKSHALETDIPEISAFARTLLDDTTGAAMFATLGATQSFGSNGYCKLPNGFMIQWGTSTGNTNKSFPTAFPNACRGITGGIINGANDATRVVQFYSGPTTTTFRPNPTYISHTGGGGTAGENYWWIAWGN